MNKLKYLILLPGLIFLGALLLTSCGDSSTISGNENKGQSKTKTLPEAGFDYTIQNPGNLPAKVQFTDSSKHAISFLWNFDNGDVSRVTNPEHSFDKSGDHTVEQIVINGNGKDTVQTVITIPKLKEPKAQFGYNYLPYHQPPIKVQFTDSSEFAHSYQWYFGDGKTSANKNPVHAFSDSGAYTVKLKVGNDSGENVSSQTINVEIPNPTNFTRFIYFRPKGTPYHENFRNVLKSFVFEIQNWFKNNAEGYTFQLDPNKPVIDTVEAKYNRSYFLPTKDDGGYYTIYKVNSYLKNNVQLLPGQPTKVFIDLGRNQVDPRQNGAGLNNIAYTFLFAFSNNQSAQPSNAWTGCTGHELGHALGLPHPGPKDNPYLTGYLMGKCRPYPNVDLHPSNIKRVKNSKWFYKFDY